MVEVRAATDDAERAAINTEFFIILRVIKGLYYS